LKNKENIYVVGFPKSGNTWLARLIAEVTNSTIDVKDESDVINNVDNKEQRKGKYKIHKLHDSTNSEKILESNKVVYIVRDVRDVLISGFFFNNPQFNEEQVKNNWFIKKYFNYEIKKLNNIWQGNLFTNILVSINILISKIKGADYPYGYVGSWSEHINIWSNHSNTIAVKYEDMLIDTHKELQRIAEFLNLDIDDDTLRKAIANQSFKNKKKKFLEEGDDINAKFMRSGKSGKWKDFLDDEVIRLIESKHKSMMNKYEYLKIKRKN